VNEPLLVDTGPIVAILSRRDPFHDACFRIAKVRRQPLLTCWPVLTEAAWLLRARPAAVKRLCLSVDEGLFRLLDLDARAPSWIANFLDRYRKLGAQLADAALKYLAEQRRIRTIFTLDRREFGVYRLENGDALRLVPE
jgi:hypothetical protein